MRAPFVFNEIEHWTGPDLMETVALIMSRDEADVFMSAYVEACDSVEHGYANIAYICEIIGGDDAQEVAEMFGITLGKTQEPLQWFAGSSYGVKS